MLIMYVWSIVLWLNVKHLKVGIEKINRNSSYTPHMQKVSGQQGYPVVAKRLNVRADIQGFKFIKIFVKWHQIAHPKQEEVDNIS